MAEGKQFTSGAPKATKPGAKTPKPKKQSYAEARKGIIARSKAKYGHAPSESAVKATYAKYKYPVPGPKPRAPSEGGGMIGKGPNAKPFDPATAPKPGTGSKPATGPKPPNNTIAPPMLPPSTPIDYGTISTPPTGATRKKAPASKTPKGAQTPAKRAPGMKASKIRSM